jgi:hypothetical protein
MKIIMEFNKDVNKQMIVEMWNQNNLRELKTNCVSTIQDRED